MGGKERQKKKTRKIFSIAKEEKLSYIMYYRYRVTLEKARGVGIRFWGGGRKQKAQKAEVIVWVFTAFVY